MDEQLAKEIIKNGIKKVIIDDLEIIYTPGVTSILRTAELVQFYYQQLPDVIKTFKIVSIANQDIKEFAEFWETYAQNRGFDLRVFYTFEDALKFIKS